MRYLCAVYVEPEKMEKLSAAEGATLNRDSIAYDETLRRSGITLRPTAAACDHRQNAAHPQGQAVGHGRSFAETKEQLGGFILIEARDMDEAVELASKIPMANTAASRCGQ